MCEEGHGPGASSPPSPWSAPRALLPDLVDYGFTASMENDLDEIAEGTQESLPGSAASISAYRGPANGNGSDNGHPTIDEEVRLGLKRRSPPTSARSTPRDQLHPDRHRRERETIVVRVGRYGPYLQRGDERASIPRTEPRRPHLGARRGAAGRPVERPGTRHRPASACGAGEGRRSPLRPAWRRGEGTPSPRLVALRLHVAGT